MLIDASRDSVVKAAYLSQAHSYIHVAWFEDLYLMFLGDVEYLVIHPIEVMDECLDFLESVDEGES